MALGEDLLSQGRAALRLGDAAAARRAFEAAVALSPSGDALEGVARACYLALDMMGAIASWERAYPAHRSAGDAVGAVRVARTLGGMYGSVVGDWAVWRGWVSRATTLLGAVPSASEAGWVALNTGMFEPDPAHKEQQLREALDEGRRGLGDADLEVAALGYLGAFLVLTDRALEGMPLLDEALAALAGDEVDDFSVLQEVFCELFKACEHTHDVARAEGWIRIGDAIAARRSLPAVSALCRTHYGGVLTAAGRWPEAEAALTEAVRFWGLTHHAGLRDRALVRLAYLRVCQGRSEEAAQLLAGLEHDLEAALPLAAIHLQRGETERAADVLERALAQVDQGSSAAAPLWAALVDVHLAAGRIADAEVAAARLEAVAQRHGTRYLEATAALARGRVSRAAGTGDPRASLRAAVAGFSQAQMPMELARSRLELAGAEIADHPEVALAEARGALEAFERLHAAGHAGEAAALMRTLGAKPPSPRPTDGRLTRREEEVLDILSHGGTNPEIAQRLYISRKTVEHHVGNILAKLGLRSRAEAAAYAARRTGGAD